MQKKTMRPIFVGWLFVITYCVVTAASSVIVNYSEVMILPVILLAYSFLISAIYFNVINIRKYHSIVKMYKSNFGLVVGLNIATAITWAATFSGLKYSQPDIFVGLAYGFLTICITLLTISNKKAWSLIKIELIFAALIFLVMVLLVVDDFYVAANISTVLVSIFAALIMAIAGAFGIIYQHQLARLKYSATQVLAIRFNLLVIISLFILLAVSHVSTTIISYWYLIILVALSSVMLPLYFLQKGIERIDPVFVTFIIPFVPIMTFVLELFNPKFQFSWVELILLGSLTIILLSASWFKIKLMSK